MAIGTRGCQAASALKRQGDKPTGVRRHLEGWELALLTLAMALLAALVALPRPVEPDDFPVPDLDPSKVADINRAETERAQRVSEVPLPYGVRAAGEAFRAVGTATFRNEDDLPETMTKLVRTVKVALEQHGAEPLLSLRAIQCELFLTALKGWEATGVIDTELIELGGAFLEKAQSSHWFDDSGRLALSSDERRILFRVRWGVLTGLGETHPFEPTLSEWRVYYAFLLRHPEGAPQLTTSQQLSYVNALARVDPAYPADYARGVLLYRGGRLAEAARAFSGHLERYPSGRWALRARNFWLATQGQL